MSNDITICSVAYNDKTTGLLDLMIRSVKKFTSGAPQFIICDSGGNNLDKYSADKDFTIIDNKQSKSRGSLQHGEGLNKIIATVKTKYTAIIESDCIITDASWSNLYGSRIKAAVKKNTNNGMLYHVCALIFETKLLQTIDWRPGNSKNRGNRSYAAEEDCGWQIHGVIGSEKVCAMQFMDTKSGNGKILNNDFCADEFWCNGGPILIHFGRGSNIGGKKSRKGFLPNKKQMELFKNIAENIINGK